MTSAYSHVGTTESTQPEWAQVSLSDSTIQEPDAELGLGRSSSSTDIDPSQPSRHKIATFFHLFFKVSALLMYLFCSFFLDNFILVFVVCVLLLAFDFWTVKNITGRLLVGLRWWNEIREDGTNVWIFESKPENHAVHPRDSLIFWTTLYVTPVVWLLFGLAALLSFKLTWLLIVCVGVTLSGANVVGYWKCQRDSGTKLKSFLTQRVLQAAVQQTTGQSMTV